MLLDVLTLVGALYVLLTVVEFLCSLLKPATESARSDRTRKSTTSTAANINNRKDVCNSCRQRSQQAEAKIQYIVMAKELGSNVQQQPGQRQLDQYQSEILKRKKRIAAGEVKGFYMSNGGAGTNETGDPNSAEGSAGADRRHSSYSGDHNIESGPVRTRSLTKDAKSCDDPSGANRPSMVGLTKDPEHGYYIDPNNWMSGNESKSHRQRQFQHRSSLDDRRASLDTVPVKLSAPVTIVQSSSGSGSPFKISENSAFTPIQPRRDASVEKRPPFLSATGGSLHAQSFPDVSGGADSGIHTAAASTASSSSAVSTGPANAQGPIQITVVMRPTNGSGSGQQPASQKATSTLVWTSTGSSAGGSQQKRRDESLSAENRLRPVVDAADKQSKPKDRQPSPVRLKMVQTVTSAFHESHSESKTVQPTPSDQKKEKDAYQQKGAEPESPIKLKITQPSGVQCEDNQHKSGHPSARKPYVKSSTTGLASTAALAKATAAANYRNNYYSNSLTSKDFETVAPHRRQHTPPPPPPPPSSELLTPQLLKKQHSPLHDTFPRNGNRQYYPEQAQMAVTRAMRTSGAPPQQAPKIFYGASGLIETALPQPYHPPTMASYEHAQPLPPSPRPAAPDAGRFAFGSASGGQGSSFEGLGRQQQRTRYSPVTSQNQYHDDSPNVVWRPTEARGGTAVGGGGDYQHSLSVDEGIGHERSRSRERSRIRRQQQPGYSVSVDERAQPLQQAGLLSKTSAFDHYRSSYDEDKGVTREITDQGVPTTDDVLKGGNVSSKTKLFEALAEQELQEVDSQIQHFYQQQQQQQQQQQRRPVQDRWVPPAGSGNSLTPKHKKMERSHTVHTVRSLMAPDAYQYENAPYNHKNPYLSFQDQPNRYGDQKTPSPRLYNAQAPIPAFYAAQKLQEAQVPPPMIHVTAKQEAIQFPPASISPRSVHKEHAVIEKGHPFQQAQVFQPQQPHWQPRPPSPPVRVQIQQIPAPLPIPVQPAPIPVPVQQAPVVVPAPILQVPAANQRQERVSVVVEPADVYEDEMSKMSIADKAKLFELKAEEQSRTKRRYNTTTRHKTQPVTTDEVMKARSVINEQLAKPVDVQKQLKSQKSGASDEAEREDENEKAGSRSSIASGASRNVIIYQRAPDKRSTNRVVDDGLSDKDQRDSDQRQSTPSSVKPRRVVYLHDNDGGNANLDLPAPTATNIRKQSDTTQPVQKPPASDQNNNEKADKPSEAVVAKSGDSAAVTASLVNGFHKKASPPPRVRQSESSTPSAIKEPDRAAKDKRLGFASLQRTIGDSTTDSPYGRSTGVVREKTKRLMADINAKQSAPSRLSNGSMANGHSGHLPSRILVNHDDDDHGPLSNGNLDGIATARAQDSALDRFCSRARDLERIDDEAEKVEDDSFMSVATAPVIRLQHFERPKPNRRHSTCSSRMSVSQSTETMRDKNGAIIVNQ